MGILDTKVAVITGGTRGLGLAIAMAYAREGASVVIASRSSKSVEAAVQQLKDVGAKAAGIAIDVSDLAQVEDLANYAVSQFGRIDVWVNNAGTAGPYGATLGYTPEAFRQVLDTNITGVYNGSRTAMQVFLKQGSGKLTTSSGMATIVRWPGKMLMHPAKPGDVPLQKAWQMRPKTAVLEYSPSIRG